MVLVHRGTLPIVLTAPHGGRLAIPGMQVRNAKDPALIAASANWGGVHLEADGNTDVLAVRIASGIEKLTGHAPYLVLAKFERTFIDANRPPEIAYADPAAAPYYDFYRKSVRAFVDEIRSNYPAGLLLDVHGQAKDAGALMRGTLNGETVTLLVRRAGVDSLVGPEGLFGQLEAQGFKVFPSNRAPIRGSSENGGYNGGYTVRAYGSNNANGIDAVQLEFGTRYRKKDEVEKSADAAARAIVTFYKAYLETAGKDRR